MLISPFKQQSQASLYELFIRISKGIYQPLNPQYTEQLKSVIDQMLQLDPKQRPTAGEVMEISAKIVAQEGTPSAAGVPALLVMDDILEKLKLFDYERLLLQPRKWGPFHKTTFVRPLGKEENQLEMLVGVLEWLLDMRHDLDCGP